MRKVLLLFAMLMGFSLFAFSQTKMIEGKVVDNLGNGIPYASVIIKSTKIGTTTDENGNYKIQASSSQALVASASNFNSQEYKIGSADVINFTLTPNNALDEVVVTAVNVRRTERTTGYAISKVDPSSLLQKSEPDILKGLQGKVAGVDIRSSQGTPGAGTRIQIRGNSSFFGDNQPLIVVDGVPYSNTQLQTTSFISGGAGAYGDAFSNLDPNDIASMNVLKGASAAALYGSRASNGVIIVTTKSGSVARNKKGATINLRSSLSLEQIANLPEYQNDYGTGSQGVLGGGSNGSWGARFGSPGNDSTAVWSDYGRAYPELFPTGKVPYQAYPNNVKDLFQTGLIAENSVSFDMGDQNASFALTASNLSQGGYLPANTYTRNNISMGGSAKLKPGLNVRGNFSYSRSNQKGGLFGENQSSVPTSSQFARALFLGRSWDMSLPYEDKNHNSIAFVAGQFDNPYWAEKYNTSVAYNERIVAGMHLDYQITKWARLDYNFGSNVNTISQREVVEVSSRGTSKGTLTLDNYRLQELESDLLLSLSPDIGKDLSLKGTLGTSFNQRKGTREFGSGGLVTGDGYIIRGIHELQNFLPADRDISDTYDNRRLLGIFGDVTLGYKNWAFVTVTGRNDVSSTLPENNRSYFYPSVSGSFIFSDAFDISKSVMDFGKLRAGWAKVGKDATPYNTGLTYSLGSTYLGQPTGNVSTSANSPDLKPEFTREIELGFQLSFLKRLFELDFTWYNKESSNMLAPVTVAPSTGYSSFYTNFGGLSNKGVEIEAILRPIRTGDFNWEIRGVYTRNKNIVTSLTEGLATLNLGGGFTGGITNELTPGLPYGYLYGTKSLRDKNTGALIINPQNGTLYEDVDGGLQYLGNPSPLYKMGITNTFSYKGVFLSALFDMTKGGSLYSVTVSSLLGRGVSADTRDRETDWVIPGYYGNQDGTLILDASGNPIPNHTRITTNDVYFSPANGNTFAINAQDEWNVYDATVYRIREVTLGYDLPKAWMQKIGITAASISLSGRNLWYLAPGFPKYTHFDPEAQSYGTSNVQGLEFSAAPTARRFGLNLNITF